MSIASICRSVSLVAGVSIAACMQHQTAPPAQSAPAATITFHNSGRDRVQVYLIGDKESWLLGRLEPMETAHLRLPESSAMDEGDVVVLGVLPGWSKSLAPRADARVRLSIAERRTAMSGEEWIFVNGQLQGPRPTQRDRP
jgi:hypothetical protein